MIPLPTPQQLRYLTALAEFQHFGRAADSCAVTQSTLSAGLLALERQMDTRILDRDNGKRVLFTPLGRDLVDRARVALAALSAMVDAADAVRAPMSGKLRMGVIPTVSPFLLPRLMPGLRQSFPNLRLFLREDTTPHLIEGLGAGRLDVALLALPCSCQGFETLPVIRDDFMAALPPGHPLAARDSVPAHMLTSEQMLLLEDGHCLRDQVMQACGYERGDTPPVDFAATSLHTLVQMVAGGLGVTLLPKIAINAGVTDNTGIVLRPLTGDGGFRMLGFAWRPGAARAAEYRAMAPLLAESAEFSAAPAR
jgi:LysR family hydrogen peroxide-inducible transcriptional activator